MESWWSEGRNPFKVNSLGTGSVCAPEISEGGSCNRISLSGRSCQMHGGRKGLLLPSSCCCGRILNALCFRPNTMSTSGAHVWCWWWWWWWWSTHWKSKEWESYGGSLSSQSPCIPHGDLYTDSTLKKGRGLSQLQVVVEKWSPRQELRGASLFRKWFSVYRCMNQGCQPIKTCRPDQSQAHCGANHD